MKRILLLVVAVALALVAQEILHRRLEATDAVLLYAGAVALFWLAFRRGPSEKVAAPEEAYVPRPLNRWHLLVPASALAPLLVAIIAWNANGFTGVQSYYAFFIYLAGFVLFCYGVHEVSRAEGPAPSPFPRILTPRVELLAVLGITAIGAFMLFYRLDSLPFGVWYDEADSALEAIQILGGAPYSPAAFHFRFNPSLYFQYVALIFRLFGEGVLQIRFASASLGLLAIPATYVMAKSLLGQRTALVAAFLMAVARWHFDFGRWGMFFVSSTVFDALALCFLLRALRYRRWSDFAWTGLLLGGGLQTYTAFRLVPFAAVAVAGYWVLTQDLWPALRQGKTAVADLVKSLTPRLAIVLMTAMVAIGPFGLFAIQNPDLINERLDQASVFARKDTTEQKLAALGSNIQKHALMFNYRGDNNGRHNLPGDPMLDPTTGAFFILGLAWCLTNLRDPVRVSLLLWLVICMLGGILSLDFEAPQAVRTIIAVPVLCVIAAKPAAMVWEAVRGFSLSWARSAQGRQAATVVACLVPLVIFVRAGSANFNTYFVRQANDFAVWSAYSTPETITARRANELGSGYSYYIANFIAGTPTMRFLSPWLKTYQVVASDMIFPLYRAGDKPVAIFLDAQKTTAFSAAKRYYPGASLVPHAPPFGGSPVLYEIVLKPEDVQAVQGLTALFYRGTEWQGEPAVKRRDARLEADWRQAAPLTGDFSAEWQGTLYVPAYGRYVLALTAPGAAKLYVDEYEVAAVPAAGGVAEATLTMARGNHAVRARAVGAPGAVRLAWQPPGSARETVPTESLYAPPVLANGLTGKYYRNTDWSGEPALAQVDPSLNLYFHVPTLPRPYTVEWSGKIAIPSAGSYAFGLESIDDSWLYLDGQPVTEAHEPNVLSEGRVTLTAGLHDIRVRFLDKSGYSHINLYWTVPGQGRAPVPSERLFPPQGAYPTPVAAIPPPATLPTPPAVPLPPGTVSQLTPLTSTAVMGGPGTEAGQFLQPRDIAVNSQGAIFVADTGNRRVQRLDAEGHPVAVLQGTFEEPLALVTDAADNLYVLDSVPGWIYRYDKNGQPTGRFGGAAAQLYHPRGMAIDMDANLYVADTGGCRVVKFSPAGDVIAKYGSKGTGKGQFVEPTDVAVGPNGLMYVADAGNRRVVVLDAAGGYVGEWAAPQSVAYNGIHLALSQGGLILVTDPEGGRLLGYDSAGRLLQQTGRKGAEPGLLLTPVGVLAGADGRVYVAEVGNQRVQVFR